MATTVNIWMNSPSETGHVSIQIHNTYISFWPSSAAKAKKDIKIGQTHQPAFPSSYKVDCRLEGKESDHKILIENLDEKLMVDYWNLFKKNPAQYNMLKSNCSTITAAILELGSGISANHKPSIPINDYVNNPYLRLFMKLRFMGNHINMWTPNDVLKYAHQINNQKCR